MAKVFFLKYGMSRPFYSNNRIVPFVNIGDDSGLLELDTDRNPKTVAALRAASGTLGIEEVTAERAEEAKKNGEKLRRKPSRPEVRIDSLTLPPHRPAPAEGAVAASDPVEVPKTIPQPRTRKPRAKPATDSLAPVPQVANAEA